MVCTGRPRRHLRGPRQGPNPSPADQTMWNLHLTAPHIIIHPPTLSPRSFPVRAEVAENQEQSVPPPPEDLVTAVKARGAQEAAMLQPMGAGHSIVQGRDPTVTVQEGDPPRL